MRSRVSRWGNSPAIRIPSSFSREIQLEDGDTVDLRIEHGHLTIVPVRKTYTLDELLAGVTDENLHEETDWGQPMGKEVW